MLFPAGALLSESLMEQEPRKSREHGSFCHASAELPPGEHKLLGCVLVTVATISLGDRMESRRLITLGGTILMPHDGIANQ